MTVSAIEGQEAFDPISGGDAASTRPAVAMRDTRQPPLSSDWPAGEGLDDEGHVDEALRGRDVG